MPQKTRQELLQKIKELELECNQLRQESKNAAYRDQYIREILDNIPAPIYLKDAQGNYKRVNKKYEELAGVKLADIVGKNDFDIFPQPVAELFQSQDKEVIQQGLPLEFEETIPLADGIHTYITSKFPLHGKDGAISAVGGFCTDITKRKLAEDAKEELIIGLQKAQEEVNLLSGLIPICATCKKIRDDNGYWNRMESYISSHSKAEFSHSICPDCAQKSYPDLYKEITKEKN